MFESKSGIFFLAGIAFFALAFISNGLLPAVMYSHLPEKTVEQMIAEQLDSGRPYTIMNQLQHLHEEYREQCDKYQITPTREKCAELLRLGRRIYVAEGCWHCHSQFVRPVSNEEQRWGPVARSAEYQNELQRPVMFGTRRVGPDLSREGGRRSNDWHATHFFRPRLTSPASVMPDYPWFFDGDPGKPNQRGLALILYMQWQGSWLPHYPYFSEEKPARNP